MGYLVNPVSGTIETFSYFLKSGSIMTMGSIPIPLNFDTGIINQYVYVPLNAFFLQTSGTIPYDFTNSDHPIINSPGRIFQWYEPIQNYNSNTDTAFATITQKIKNNQSHAFDLCYKINASPFMFLTTATGNDATVGDYEFTLYITAYKLTF